MAGSLKPNIANLGKEGQWNIISFQDDYGGIQKNGLFDEKQSSSWNTSDVFYFQNSIYFIEIELKQKSNIWRQSSQYKDRYGMLKILKKENDGNYVDVTDKYSILTTDLDAFQWEMFVKDIPAGIYKFVGGNEKRGNSIYRLDSEWYIEEINNSKYLMKQGDNYLSIRPEFYKELGQPKDDVELGEWFEKYGSEDLTSITTEHNKNTKIGVDKGNIGEGKYFSMDFNNDFLSVNEVK